MRGGLSEASIKQIDQYITELQQAKDIATEIATKWAESHQGMAKRTGVNEALHEEAQRQAASERARYSAREQAADEYAEVERRYRGTAQWMKAPNGQPTDLTERQWVQVRTPRFKAWFGDWEAFAGRPGGVWNDDTKAVSKVVDANGEPMVVYHGTDLGGFMMFREPSGERRGDLGIFATNDKSMAASYVRRRRAADVQFASEEVMPRGETDAQDGAHDQPGIYALFANIRDPEESDFEGANWDGSRANQWVVEVGGEVQNDASGKRYFDSSEEATEVASEFFSPEQIEEGVDPADYVRGAEDHYNSTDDVVRDAIQMKRDGAIITEVHDDGGGDGYSGEPATVVVALKPDQLKSADWNTGEFDESGDLRFSKRPVGFADPADRVEASTTVPSKKFKGKLVSDAADEKWVIDSSDILASEKHTAAVTEAIKHYNAVDLTDKEDALRALHDTAVDNLLWLYNKMPEVARERAKQWYVGANRIALGLAERYGYSLRQVSGVMAVLSPQKDWFMNASLGERVIKIVAEHSQEKWSQPMTAWLDSYVNAAKTVDERDSREKMRQRSLAMHDKRLADLNDKDAALFVRVFDETYNPRSYRIVTPEGGFDEFVTKESEEVDAEADDVPPGSVAWGSLVTIEKSISILRDNDRATQFRTISNALGKEHKVRNFYNNIVSPGSADGHVTIDTHAIAAAFVKALSGESIEVLHNFGRAAKGGSSPGSNAETGASGLYGIYADAYRDAAARLGILPRELQSITWEAVRAIYSAQFKSKQAKEVEAIYDRYRAGEITREEARDLSYALAGGIGEMPWGDSAGRQVQDGGTSYDGDLAASPADRPARLLEPFDARDRITVSLSAATSTIPGIAAVHARAQKGDMQAARLLQDAAYDALKHLLAGTSAKIKRQNATGLYGGEVEPSLGVTLTFGDSDRAKVLAALARFADNFNQQQIHVRRATSAKAGTQYADGSYATPVYRFDLSKALDRRAVQRVIDKSGLYGLTFGDDFVEAYFVGDATNVDARREFADQIDRARGSLGGAVAGYQESVARLWPYGDSFAGEPTIGYEAIRGDVSAGPVAALPTARRIAEYLNAVDGKPGRVKTFEHAEITPEQAALQREIAAAYEALPDNDLKNPRVRKAYQHLANEVLRQFKALPVKVEVMTGQGEPYANSNAMRRDLADNNHLFIFGTTADTFGPPGEDFSRHPLLKDSGLKDQNGYPLLYNDLLRAVHDYYAHALSPAQFGPKGEEAAWKNHMAMTADPWARWALTMETRGQNSWVNFRDDLDRSTPLAERPFARQKAALIPVEYALTGDRRVDAPMRKFIEGLPERQRVGSKPVKPTNYSQRGILAEVAPHPDQEVAQEWREMSRAERVSATEAVARKTISRVFELMGLKGWSYSISTGSFEGEVNPNVLLKAPEGTPTELIQEAANVMGYVWDQKAMIEFDESNTSSDSQAGFVKVVVPPGMPAETIDRLRAHIAQRVPQADGDALRGGSLVYGNFSEFNDKVETLDDTQFHEALRDAAEAFDWDGAGIEVLLPERFHSGYIQPETRDDYLKDTRYGESHRKEAEARGDDLRWRRGRGELERVSEEALALRDRWIAARRAAKHVTAGGREGYVVGQPEAVAGPVSDRGDGAPGDAQAGPGGPVGSVERVAVHFSKERRRHLNTSHYGSGLKGAEAARLNLPENADIRRRLYFYVPREGSDRVFAESGVGAHPHTVALRGLYPASADPLGIMTKSRPGLSAAERTSQREREIMAAGYSGLLLDNYGGINDFAVLLGKHDIDMGARKSRRTDGFERFVGDADLVEMGEPYTFRDSQPVVVQSLHGTTADFTEFKPERGNIEADLGAGFYSTNNQDDVEFNYAGKGPDLTVKMEMEVERLEDQDMDRAEAERVVRERYMANDGFTMPLYVKFDKPAVLGGEGETFLTLDESYNEETEEYGEATGTLLEFADALREVADDGRYLDADAEQAIGELMDGAFEDGGVSLSKAIQTLKSSEGLAYATDEDNEGRLASSEIIRLALEHMGYDGIIDTTVNDKFGTGKKRGGMRGMHEDTVHFVSFKPGNIKSALGNNGEFNTGDKDIRHSRREYLRKAEENGYDTGKVYFHGTTAKTNFARFKVGKGGYDELGPGIYITSDPWYADAFNGRGDREGGRTMPVFLRKGDLADLSKRPAWRELAERVIAREDGSDWKPGELSLHIMATSRDKANFNRWLERAGYIGAVDPNSQIPGQVVVFDPTSLKSAIGNRGTFDSTDPDIRHSQRQTDTPAFKAWFGDSKVVDADGKPLVVYHGTSADVTTFSDKMRRGGDVSKLDKAGIYFTTDAALAARYGEATYPVYLKAENLLSLPSADFPSITSGLIFPDEAAEIQAAGYDAVISGNVIVVFNPEQIKSATGNRGTFDPASPDIRRSQREDVSALGFYSELARKVEDAGMKQAPAGAWKSYIKALTAKGVKPDEILWSGVEDWLGEQTGKVPKEAVVEFLRGNGVQAEETTLGQRWGYIDPSGNRQSFATEEEAQESFEHDQRWVDEDSAAVHDDRDADSPSISVSEESSNSYLFFAAPNEDGVWVQQEPPGYDREFDSAEEALEAAEEAADSSREYWRGQMSDEVYAMEGYGGARYREYALPGGENYREVLLTLPRKTRLATLEEVNKARARHTLAAPLTQAEYDDLLARGEIARVDAEPARDTYKSGHFDQPNILAHLRVDDRADVEGRRVLFVEEVQSDWGQDAKKKGVKTPHQARVPDISAKTLTGREFVAERSMPEAAAQYWLDGRNAIRGDLGKPPVTMDDVFTVIYEDGVPKIVRDGAMDPDVEADKHRRNYEAIVRDARVRHDAEQANKVPAAPFIGKTDGWLNLALKRVVAMAVDGNYDAVAFVTGEQSADRYDLSRQVSKVTYNAPDGWRAKKFGAVLKAFDKNGSEVISKSVEPSELEDYIGKEAAKKLIETAPVDGLHTLSGQDLKVGGGGMKTFYDQIVPNAAKALLKKTGGSMSTIRLDGVGTEQPGFVITDKMRESVQAGQPLFSRREGGNVDEIEQAIAKTYGKALDKLQAKGLVALVQTREQALEAAARARSAATGEPLDQVRAGLMERVRRALRLWSGTRTVNDALVPETPEYAGNRTGDLASIPAGAKLPAGPIRVPVGVARQQHAGFGLEHLADNARRDASRMPPQQTGDLPEDLMRQTVAVLRGVRQAHEHEGAYVLVDPVAKQAVVARRRGSHYAVVSVRPYRGDPVALWGNPEWRGRLTFPPRVDAATTPSTAGQQIMEPRSVRDGQDVLSEKFDFNWVENGAQGSEPRGSQAGHSVPTLFSPGYPGEPRAAAAPPTVTYKKRRAIEIKPSADGRLQGFYEPASGRSFLIADALTPETAPGVLVHEVGIHMAADAKGWAAFEPIAARASELLHEPGAFFERVRQRMDQAGETSGEEAAAYIAEEYERDRVNAPASVKQWIKELLAALRRWLLGKGLAAAKLDEADIAAIARANVRELAERRPAPVEQRPGGLPRYSEKTTPKVMTEEQARAAGFTMKVYRGVSKSNPFADPETTWMTTSKEVAEAYADEVFGYDDPGLLEMMLNPDGIPRYDASRLSEDQLKNLRANEFGQPQAVGIYDNSDDHPLGGSRRKVTVIHAPIDATVVVGPVEPGGVVRHSEKAGDDIEVGTKGLAKGMFRAPGGNWMDTREAALADAQRQNAARQTYQQEAQRRSDYNAHMGALAMANGELPTDALRRYGINGSQRLDRVSRVLQDVLGIPARQVRPILGDAIRAGAGLYGGKADFVDGAEAVRRAVAWKKQNQARHSDRTADAQFRDTERAHGGQAAYERARAAGQTKLGYRQWVQVRTPRFNAWFGDWQAARARKRLTAMDAVPVQGLPQALEGGALREKARQVYAAQASAGPVTMKDGREVGLTMVGFKKTRYHSADRRVLDLLGSIRDVLASAEHVASLAHEQENPGDSIRAWHYYGAKVRINGKEWLAKLVVRESVNGQIYYDNDLSGVEEVSGRAGDAAQSKTGAAAVSADAHTLADLLAQGKPEAVSKVVDPATGEPLVVYRGEHGASTNDQPMTKIGNFTFVDDEDVAEVYANEPNDRTQFAESPHVFAAYLSIQNPAIHNEMDPFAEFSQIEDNFGRDAAIKFAIKHGDWVVDTGNWQENYSDEYDDVESLLRAKPEEVRNLYMNAYVLLDDQEFTSAAKAAGFDGGIHMGNGESAVATEYRVFSPTQIKSASENNGNFDGADADIRRSTRTTVGESDRAYTPEQRAMFGRVGRTTDEPTLIERVKEWRKDIGKKLAQGIVDQFRPIRDLDQHAYALARLSKGAAGAFEALLHHGKLKIVDGVYDADTSGGFIEQVARPLGRELDDFVWWVAANRAERLAGEGRENLFTPADIAAGKSLASGTLSRDYTLANGQVTRDRALAYADSLKKMDAFNKNVLDMAEQSGLIDGQTRPYWDHEFYVPFYRVSEEDGGFLGEKIKGGLARQRAFKTLKGGQQKLNADLVHNMLQNWAHLIDASAKNRAAKETMEAALNVGIAIEASQDLVRQLQKQAGGKTGTAWFMDEGKERHFLIEDPYVLEAINSLSYAGLKGPMMTALSKAKHWLTLGVTASPGFKVRNLIRDSLQAIATADLDYNPVTNLGQGFRLTGKDKATGKHDPIYVSALASGGLIRFGTGEASHAENLRRLIKRGVPASTILDTPQKVREFFDKNVQPLLDAYNEIGSRGEEINRASLYKQLVDKGVGPAEAALQARDLMDFSMQGTWGTIRFLTQVVPFLNARLQGLYKLGRAGKEDPRRFAMVLGATALASVALLALYHDDDDWKKREEWDRDAYWWFKLGGVALRIPKPFEIGAIASIAERGVELFVNDEFTAQRFLNRMKHIASDNLSMNPIPQALKPVLDVYANIDSFSGRPIESMGMERLRADYRFNSRTSVLARGASTAMNAVSRNALGMESLSPVQIDQLIRGYFGWLGTFAVSGADLMLRPMMNEPKQPSIDYLKVVTQGMAATVPADQSKYVSSIYEQAQELDRVYATYRQLVREGKLKQAGDFAADNADMLRRQRLVAQAKKIITASNQRVRAIENDPALDGSEKRERISREKLIQSDAARRVY